MTGAEAILRTLAASGVRACFANPGTSEMHLVAALDRVSEVRPVLTLFEGVASGAADGYGRMTGEPAATLLHLGPGLGNAFANLHNAYKARTPLVNLVGDHAVAHAPLGAPLASDIPSVARPASHWLAVARDARSAPAEAAAAVAAARSRGGGVATLIVPADAGWGEAAAPAPPMDAAPRDAVPEEAVEDAAQALRGGARVALLLGGAATREPGLQAAARIAAATGARVLHETFPARLERGAGVPAAEPLPYLTEMATASLAGLDHLVVAGAQPPVAFFAYPGLPSLLADPDTTVHVLAGPREDAVKALESLVAALDAPGGAGIGGEGDRAALVAGGGAAAGERRAAAPGGATAASQARAAVAGGAPAAGPLDPGAVGAVLAQVLPEGAIVVDEAVTAAAPILQATARAPRHDWLTLTGGAIGQGLPAATGAAVACPDRPVISLEADGSAMYTIQALWTQAREGLDVTTVILANRSYAILEFELARVGAGAGGEAARRLFDLGSPPLDFVALARGMGVPGRRVEDAAALHTALREALAEPGPHLVEAAL